MTTLEPANRLHPRDSLAHLNEQVIFCARSGFHRFLRSLLEWRAPMASRFLPVYKLVKKIPRGRVMTYGGIARALRWRNGARTVGWAMHNCPSGLGLPWHRVVGAGGRILLREPKSSLQIRLLESEGIPVRERRVNLAQHEWVPKRSRASTKKIVAMDWPRSPGRGREARTR